MLRSLAILATLVACGAKTSPPAQTPAPPPGPGSGSAAAAPASSCPAGQITIEHCVVGGMPNEDGTANVSCGTACSATAPTGSQGHECQQVSPDHYRCTAYAP